MAFNQTVTAPSHKMRRCLLMAFALIALALTALPTASFAGTTQLETYLRPKLTRIRPAPRVTCTGPAKALT